MSKALSEIFDVDPVTGRSVEVVINEGDSGIALDAAAARANMKSLISSGTAALAEVINVSIQSESPRSYEVVANLLNTLADLNTKLLATYQLENKVRADEGANGKSQVNNTQNNYIFQGTPSELAKLLKQGGK